MTKKTAPRKGGYTAAVFAIWLFFISLALLAGFNLASTIKGAPAQRSYDAGNVGEYVTLIGDSISHQSREEISQALPGVDFEAVSGIQFDGYRQPFGEGGLTRLKKHTLRDVVVFLLGSNNGVNAQQLTELYDYVGPNRKLVLMTTYVGQILDSSITWNTTILDFAQKHDNIIILDWYSANADDPDRYLFRDRLHPNLTGRQIFAQMVKDAVLESLDLN